MADDRLLRILIGDPLPETERKMWLAMSKGQRKKAMRRMKAIARWHAGRHPTEVSVAATRAGISVSRFYEMAKAWGGSRSLASVDSFATASRSRASRFEAVLSAHVKAVVDKALDDAKSSRSGKIVLKAAAEALAASAADDLEKLKTPNRATMPSFLTLRRKVQQEIRRRERRTRPGGYVKFDCCAIEMSTLAQSRRTLFTVLDRQTRLILGAGSGNAQDSRTGYGHAAADALDRMENGPLRDVAWADQVIQMELVQGLDEEALRMIGVDLIRAGIDAPMQPSGRRRRFGRYFRSIAGERVGRILILPGDRITSSATAEPIDLQGTSHDAVRVQVEVDLYNAGIVEALERDRRSAPPRDLVDTLRYFMTWRNPDSVAEG